jgi:O-antigen ligase
MASINSVAPAWNRMPFPYAAQRRMLRTMQVHIIARFAFWTLFLVTLINALWLLVRHLRQLHGSEYQLGVYPVFFAIAVVLVLAFSKGVNRSPVLLAGWCFWLIFFMGGFLGSQQITATHFRSTLEITVKPWMVVVGLPWLAMRAISQDKLPKLIRVTVLVGCIGSIVAFIQVFVPGFMQELNAEAGRGSGFWIDPNNGGIMCAIILFLSLAYPFRWRAINWVARLLLVIGVGVSFSRTGMLVLLVGWVVYGLTARRFRSLFASILAFALFIASMIAVLDVISAVSPHHAKRLAYVRTFLVGNWSDEDANNRTELWILSYQAIVDKGGLIFGLGHGSMVMAADGLAPHNYYLYVLGNSGLFALIALLAWIVVAARQAWKCGRRELRAALLAIVAIIVVTHVFLSSFFDQPPTGAILVCFTLAACYGRASANPAPIHNRLPIQVARRSLASRNPAV